MNDRRSGDRHGAFERPLTGLGCDHLFPFFKLHFIPAHYVLIEDSGARTSRFL